MKTREEVEALKWNWSKDPCWDIYDTDGFEEYREELEAYQAAMEAKWKAEYQKREDDEKAEAEKLGLHGLFKRIKELEELQERHYRAISYLADNQTTLAHKALNGRDD